MMEGQESSPNNRPAQKRDCGQLSSPAKLSQVYL
jgi:hypothetical protein